MQVYDADTALPLKEKFEGDLKKEIKKLQRYRDQIKTWYVLLYTTIWTVGPCSTTCHFTKLCHASGY